MTEFNWQKELRGFKEKLAKRLWALPTVTESEKEMVFKEYLSDLDEFEKAIQGFTQANESAEKASNNENELLRSLMGVSESDLKMQALVLAQEKAVLAESNGALGEESAELRRRVAELDGENQMLRKRLREFEGQAESFKAQSLRNRDNDIRFFSENHEQLKNQAKDLEVRISNLRHLFAEESEKYVNEKQQEIALLQKKLLEEMEATLRRKQELSWAEEEMFAKGVAQRVRTTLVSAQGQLFLTLEQLGLLDPQSKNENFWKARLHLLVEGAQTLSENFRLVQSQLQEVTGALDDYLHLTNRRKIATVPVSIPDLVNREMADIFADRRPTLSVEFLSDDPLPHVPGDPALLKFIVHELLKNAREALPHESGQIVVSIKNRSDLGLVQLLVRDSGPGIPEHLSPRLFQPFFSTKDHRQGLSLSRAKRYAEFHGGTLQLLQSGAGGTAFQVELPLDINAANLASRVMQAGSLEQRKAG